MLQTTFSTSNGLVRLTDLMPVAGQELYYEEIWPDHEVLRCIEGLEGQVDVEIFCDPRPQYGKRDPHLSDRGPIGYVYTNGTDVYVLRSEIPLELSDNRSGVTGSATLRKGDRYYVSLTYDQGEPAALALLGAAAEQRIERSIEYGSRGSRAATTTDPTVTLSSEAR